MSVQVDMHSVGTAYILLHTVLQDKRPSPAFSDDSTTIVPKPDFCVCATKAYLSGERRLQPRQSTYVATYP